MLAGRVAGITQRLSGAKRPNRIFTTLPVVPVPEMPSQE